MTLAKRQEQMIREICSLGDAFDQYAYLLVKAQLLPVLPEEQRREEALVAGCQSRVWLYVREEAGRIRFQADSDTLLLRGVLQLLTELLDGQPAEEVAALPLRLFSETELGATFTSDRNTGIRTILSRIRAGGQKREPDGQREPGG